MRRLMSLAATLPWLTLAAFWTFVVRARLEIGSWPTPGRPDPKALGHPVHMQVIYVGFALTLLSLLLLLFPARRRRLHAAGAALLVLSLVVGSTELLWFLD